MPNRLFFKNLLLLSLINSLLACNGSDARKADYLEEGKQHYRAGDYKKAKIAFDKAVAEDSDDIKSRYEIAEQLSKLGDIQDALDLYQAIIQQDAKQLTARVRAGHIYLLASKTESAEKMAKDSLAIDPENTDALVLMGGVLAAQNNSDAAFVKAETALAKKPGDVSATLLLASLHARSGNVEKAASLLQLYCEKNPNDTATRLMLVNVYLQSKAPEKAEQTLEAIIRLEPQQVEHRKRLAIFLTNNNRLDQAEKVLRNAVKELPDDVQAKLLLVEFLAARRSPETAMTELITMLERHAPDDSKGNYELQFKLTDLQLRQKQADKAEQTLKAIVELDEKGPQSSRARIKLARLYRDMRRIEPAKALIKEVLEEDPGDSDALALRGEFALTERRLPEAIADFRAILADDSENIQALKLLSKAQLMNNEALLAGENMQKVVDIAPKDEEARLDLVSLLLQTGNTEQASQHLNTLFKLNPNSRKGLEALFKIYLQQKQWQSAQQIAKKLEDTFSDEALGYYLSGLALQAEGKFDQSAARFELAMDKQPTAVEPMLHMVQSYLALKQPDKALRKLNALVKKQAHNFAAYSLMGDVYSKGNQFADAIKAYQKAIAIKPEWASPYRSIAVVNLLQKQRTAAIAILQAGINKAGDTQELMNDLATIYHEDGEHQKVIALYEQITRQHPDSLNALNTLASYLSDYAPDSASLEKAAKLAEPLAKTHDAYMLDTVAWIAYKQGDYDKSRQILLQALAADPDAAVSNYHLGMVYFRQGDKAQAKDYLQKAVSQNDEFNGWNEANETLKLVSKG